MEQFLAFFENLTSVQKLGWVFLVITITWVIEAVIPLVEHGYHKWKHAGVNFVFLGTSLVINFLFTLATVGLIVLTSESGFGILNWIDLPLWVELILAIMALDLVAQYIAHRMLHKFAWMWRFHMVHHSDTKVDATTGIRHHPGDYLIREVFSLATILLMGMPLAYYLVYRILSVLFTMLTHANISIPNFLEKSLGLIFVTPNMHKFHHHFERPWTDSNFGNIFSIWDRVFGTLVVDDPYKIKYGLDVLEDERDHDVIYQLKLPFDRNIKTDY